MLLGLFFVFLGLLLFVKFSLDLQLKIRDFTVDYTLRLRLGSFLLAVPTRLTSRVERFVTRRPSRSLQSVWHSTERFFQEIQVFKLQLSLGLGDPFWTALGCGGLWGLVGSFLSVLRETDRLKCPPEVAISPNYASSGLEVKLHCIFRFSLGHIIVKELKRLSYDWLI